MSTAHIDSLRCMSELVLIANAGDGTVSTLLLQRDPQPRLEPLTTSGELEGCGTFAVDASRDLVFAAYKGDPPGIATLRLDRATGELHELARRGTEASMTYLALHGQALLGVSYGGGFGAVWPLEGPALGDPHSVFHHANLHCVVPVPGDPDTVVYAVSLGDDLIAQFRMDAEGLLTPLDPPSVEVPAGSGPRHLVVEGTSAYVMTEFSGELVRFDVAADGTLTRAESVDVVNPVAGLVPSRIDADPQAEPLIWGADVHTAGDYVITSERNSSQLTVVGRGADGTLTTVVGYTDTEAQPRGFTVTADGRFVVAVGEKSRSAQLLEVLPDGRLVERDRAPVGTGANWVRCV